MTKAEEILEKHLKNNIDQRTYLRGSKLTYDICINAINEAINFIPCCTELKGKEAMLFEDWYKENGYYISEYEFFDKNGRKIVTHRLKKEYNKIKHTL